MKHKFIRIISPLTFAFVILLDSAAIAFGVFAVKKVISELNAAVIFFAVVEVFALIIGILVTREVLKNGIIFYDDEFEFNGTDSENVFSYSEIREIETYLDTSPSLRKNFWERHALLIITANDDKVTTLDIGLTTKNTVNKIKNELEIRVGKDRVK